MAIALRNKFKTLKEAGFTLVEVLCVLALLGLTAGLVVLNLPKPPSPMQVEVRTLAATLNLAARESVIDGKVRGVELNASGVEFFRYEGEWISETSRDFLDILSVRLDIEGQEIDLKARASSTKELVPLIHLDATGNVTPFTISLSGRDQNFLVSPDMRGKINVELQP